MVTIKAIYPYNPLSTSRIRSYRTLQVLARMASVEAYFPDPGYDDRDLETPKGVTMNIISDRKSARAMRFLRATLSGGSLSFAYYKSLMREVISNGSGDLVFVERLPLVPYTGIPVIYDAVDCFSVQVRSLVTDARGIRKPGYIYDSFVIAREQVKYCNEASLTLCTTETEANLLARDGATGPIQTFLHRSQVDIETQDAAPAETSSLEVTPGKRIASFHGRASYPANAAAVRLLERISKGLSGSVEIVVFGHGWETRSSEGFRMLGRQPDLRILRQADFGVFPMFTAVGIPNKVMECLASGLPVILSPVIAERLPPQILGEFSSRIIIAETSTFKETMMMLSRTLSRSTDAEMRFRRKYSEITNDSEKRLEESIRRLLGIPEHSEGRPGANAAPAARPAAKAHSPHLDPS